jgi:hypothetical protein
MRRPLWVAAVTALPGACPIGLLAAGECRELGTLERVGWTGGV